jgi:hypothetical protein
MRLAVSLWWDVVDIIGLIYYFHYMLFETGRLCFLRRIIRQRTVTSPASNKVFSSDISLLKKLVKFLSKRKISKAGSLGWGLRV